MNFAKNKPPLYFDTPRLHVRCHQKQDADLLFEAARESITEVFPFLPWCHPDYKKSDSVDWLGYASKQWDSGENYAFAICDKGSGRFLGGCGLNRIDFHPTANLGYWIRSSEVGQGYATEATKGLIEYGFRQLYLYRIEIIMSMQNIASKLVAEKSGGIYEGTLANRLFLHDELHDAYLYAVLPRRLQIP